MCPLYPELEGVEQGDDHQGDLNDQEDGDDDGRHHRHPLRVSPLWLLEEPKLNNLSL